MREQSTGAGSASRSGLARCTPSREAARGLASEFALIPVYREVLADMLTPVRAYTLLCPPGEPGFLLESVEGGERLARYSFIGAQARAVFDHVTRRLQLLTIHRPDREDYDSAVARIDAMEKRLAGDPPPSPARGVDGARWEPNVTKGQFHAMVDAAREYIMSGDAFQIVTSQRFRKPLAASAFDVYRCLRAINPSPYMYFLALGGDKHVVGTSPEKLVQVEDRRVETRPLAGTRRRGADPAEDQRLEKELLSDLKERAEHVMLVDLGRNDVGRVAQPGTVAVDRLMEIERYSHVMHISSTVSGQLRDGKTSR